MRRPTRDAHGDQTPQFPTHESTSQTAGLDFRWRFCQWRVDQRSDGRNPVAARNGSATTRGNDKRIDVGECSRARRCERRAGENQISIRRYVEEQRGAGSCQKRTCTSCRKILGRSKTNAAASRLISLRCGCGQPACGVVAARARPRHNPRHLVAEWRGVAPRDHWTLRKRSIGAQNTDDIGEPEHRYISI